MKEKIMTSLKTKYKNLGFSDKAFNGVANYLAHNVTVEEDIENATSGVEGLLKTFQGEVDTVRQEKSILQKKLTELEIEKNKPKSGIESDTQQVPNWFLEYKEKNEKLISSLSEQNKKLIEEQHKEKRAQIISKYVKDMDIPEWRMIGVKIDDNMQEEQIKQLLSTIKQSTINAGVPEKREGIQVSDAGISTQYGKDFAASMPDKTN